MLDDDNNNFTIEQLEFNYINCENPEYKLIMAIIVRAIKDCLTGEKHPIFIKKNGVVSIVNSNKAYVWLMNDEIKQKSLRWYLHNLPIEPDSFVRKIRELVHKFYKENYGKSITI